MEGIFISYRREESAGHAGRIYDRLRDKFGKGRVFMDVSAIEPGVDFVEAIDRAVGSCAVLLVVIGRRWLECANPAGRRRLDDPKDFIRLEVGTALRRTIRVIPVLVQDAQMPGEEDLPEEMKLLARRNAIEINDNHWDSDLTQLVETLERVMAGGAGPAPPADKTVKPGEGGKKNRLTWLISSITALFLALAGLFTGIDSFRDAFVKLFRGAPTVTTTNGNTPVATPPPAPGQRPTAPATVSVPKVIGLPEREAVATLSDAGFTAQVEQRISPDDRPGKVFHQEPQPGTSRPAGAAIVLHVAKAPAQKPPKPPPPSAKLVVPDVVGQTLETASSNLKKRGFSAEVAGEHESGEVPAGTVLRHFPKAGDKLERGGKVGLVMAIKPDEPELVTVPNVVRQPLERAVKMLTEAGLQPGAETPRPVKNIRPGTIVNQKTKPGSQVKRGSTVDLWVAVQPQEDTPPVTPSRKVLAKGNLDVRQTFLFDLDTGKIKQGGDEDIWFEAVTATERYLTPRNGAAIGIVRGAGNFENCSRARMSERRIPVDKLPESVAVCVRTNRGNLAAFRLREPVGPSPGVLKISYIVWE